MRGHVLSAVSGFALFLLGCPQSIPTADGGARRDAAVDAALAAAPCAIDPTERGACSSLPDPDSRRGSCCYREATACLGLPFTLRIASLETQTEGLGLFLQTAQWDNEDFNILLTMTEDSAGIGDPLEPFVEVQWDYGERSGTSFRPFLDEPRPGWVSGVRSQGWIHEGYLDAFAFSGRRIVGVIPSWGPGIPQVDIPMHDVHVGNARLTSGWSCVGGRVGSDWDPGGDLVAFVTVEDMDETVLYESTGREVFRACAQIAGLGAPLARCSETDRSLWANLPTAACGPTGCADRECEPALDCNAFSVRATFSAYAVAME